MIPLLALHGGAGALHDGSYEAESLHLRRLIELGKQRLYDGVSALDVVLELTKALENSGLYIAGRGASPNSLGKYELDAAIMDGRTRAAGAVAALQGFQNPIRAAYEVMTATPHVFLVGEGAAAFAATQGLAPIPNAESWFVHAAYGEAAIDERPHGTVGCVARDLTGDFAAATSTGGTQEKLAGRVGDTPLIGAGTWADQTIAVSCTGIGEYFIRTHAAGQIADRVKFGGQSLNDAATTVLQEIVALGGRGGLIAIHESGEVCMPFAAAGMKRAALFADGRTEVAIR